MDASIRVLEFKTEHGIKNGEPQSVDWVKYAPTSGVLNTATWATVRSMKPKDDMKGDEKGIKRAFLEHRWSMIEKAYDAYKAGEEIPVDGTPIGSWPALTSDQAEAFRRIGIRTIEEVANMSDSVITKVPLPDPRSYPKKAMLFLENMDKAKAAEEMQARDDMIAQLREELDAAKSIIQEHVKPKAKKTAA